MKQQIFVLAAIMFSSRLSAQDSAKIQTFEEVVVTATKYPVKTSTIGKVITVITREQLAQSGGKDLSQILAAQSGLLVNGSSSNPGKDKSIYLRGARVDHTLITIDGIPVYDASGIGGNFDIRNISVDLVERIEILKGSQSTLYGSDAIAGVINVITRKAAGNKHTFQGSLQGGSYGDQKLQGSINGSREKIDYSIGYTKSRQTGIDEAAHAEALGDKDGYRQEQWQVQLGIKPTQHISIRPFVRSAHIKGALDQGAFTDELDYTYDQKSFQTGVKSIFKVGSQTFNFLYQYNTIDRSYKDDSLLSRNGFDTYSTGAYKGREHYADFYWNGHLQDRIEITAGADFRTSQSDQAYLSISPWGNTDSKYDKSKLHQQQVGLYASALIHAPHHLTVELGDRVNFHDLYGSHQVFNINPSILLKDRLKLYANLSSAYRTPSLYQLFSEYGNDQLKPEAAITTEAGFQFFGADQKYSLRTTYFDRSVKDMIFFYYNASTGASQYINQDKQHDHGVEVEAKWKIRTNLQLTAFYNYVTGTIHTKMAGRDTSYHNLLRRPKHAIGLNLSLQVTPKLFVSTQMSYVGKRQDSFYDITVYAVKEVTLSAYGLCDVYADYDLYKKRLKWFVDLRNVTQTHYAEVSGFNTLGRNVYTGLRWTL